MAASGGAHGRRRAVIGNKKSFWLYDSESGFDLTHPDTPESPAISPRLTIMTTTAPITVDPAKSALVIIDMQNYFLSSAFGRTRGAGHDACNQLVQHAIPAARKAGIRVIWVNWGLTNEDLSTMGPSVQRAFGFQGTMDGEPIALDKYGDFRYKGGDRQLEDGKPTKKFSGLGQPGGRVPDPMSGKDVDAGRLLVRDQWNTELYGPLKDIWEDGRKLSGRNDVWVHKNRMSALWGVGTDFEKYLESEGIKTLLFAGVNTDQCVGGTYQDAFSKGYDCILLSDGAGTTSPSHSQQCIEYNAANTWGFVASCKDLADAADHMKQ